MLGGGINPFIFLSLYLSEYQIDDNDDKKLHRAVSSLCLQQSGPETNPNLCALNVSLNLTKRISLNFLNGAHHWLMCNVLFIYNCIERPVTF